MAERDPQGSNPLSFTDLAAEEEEYSLLPPPSDLVSEKTCKMTDFLSKRLTNPPDLKIVKRAKPAETQNKGNQCKITQFVIPSKPSLNPHILKFSKLLVTMVMEYLPLRDNIRFSGACLHFKSAYKSLFMLRRYFDTICTFDLSEEELKEMRKIPDEHIQLMNNLLLGKAAKAFLDKNYISISIGRDPVSRVKGIRSFHADPKSKSKMINLVNRDLENIAQFSHCSLEEFQLSNSPFLSETGYAIIAKFRKLRKLNLSNLQIPEHVFLNIAKNCKYLKEVSITECPLLTERSLTKLLNECQWLVYLNISNSANLFIDFNSFLLFGRPKLLEKLDLSCSSPRGQLSLPSLTEILESAMSLKQLRLKGYPADVIQELNLIFAKRVQIFT